MRPVIENRKTLAVLLFGLIAAMGVGCAPRQDGSDQCPDINVTLTGSKDASVGSTAALDQLLEDWVQSMGAPGCAIGVMQDDEVAYLAAYGDRDLHDLTSAADDVAWTVDTTSNVGSVSKTITALAVLRLAEELPYLDIDQPAAWYLPGGGPAGVTIRDLLRHTSGIKRDPDFPANADSDADLNALLGTNLDHPGLFPSLVYAAYKDDLDIQNLPGDDASYSNVGYMMLGAIVESLMLFDDPPQSYEEYTWNTTGFFDQSLTNGDQMLSGCLIGDWRRTDHLNQAVGYANVGSGVLVERPLQGGGPRAWEAPAGGWNMTIGDLTRLMVAIQNDSIISATSRTEMLAPDSEFNSDTDLGLGVFRTSKLGASVYMHDGDYLGYSARYTVWPTYDFGVATMCNLEEADVRGLTDAVACLFENLPGCSRSAGGDGTAGFDRGPGPTRSAASSGEPEDPDDPGLAAGRTVDPARGYPQGEAADLLQAVAPLRVECQGREATIVGTDGDDILYATGQGSVIHGGRGNDIIIGGFGTDVLCGGPGNDTLLGGPGDDRLFDDEGFNRLDGEDGDDTLTAIGDANELIGGSGHDTLGVQGNHATLWGGDGRDRIGVYGHSCSIHGGSGADTIGLAGENRLVDRDGRDVVVRSAGPTTSRPERPRPTPNGTATGNAGPTDIQRAAGGG